jgi:hypothetical protein
VQLNSRRSDDHSTNNNGSQHVPDRDSIDSATPKNATSTVPQTELVSISTPIRMFAKKNTNTFHCIAGQSVNVRHTCVECGELVSACELRDHVQAVHGSALVTGVVGDRHQCTICGYDTIDQLMVCAPILSQFYIAVNCRCFFI